MFLTTVIFVASVESGYPRRGRPSRLSSRVGQDDPQTFKRELASGLPTPSCHTATGIEMRRHPNPATLDGNSSISNGGEERTSGSKSSRKRRGTSDGKCQAGASDEVMNAALNGMVSRHGFPDTDSNITVVWATAVTDHMMVLVPPRELDWFQKNDGVDTLYASTDKGKVFARAQGVTNAVLDAAFSFGTSPDGYQSAFATIEDGSITEMYIAEDFKKGFKTLKTPAHFDYIVPHPDVYDRFLALDVESNAVSYTVYICDNTFNDAQKCTFVSEKIIDVEWIDHPGSGAKTGAWGIYYTQYQNTVEDEDLSLFHLVLDPIDPTPTPRLLKKSCDHFMQVKQYLFVTDVPNKADKDKFTEGALWISRPGTEPWGIPKWRLADFPSGESAKSQHFTVVDASENEVVAAVLHTQTDIRGIGKMVVSGVPAITQEVNLSRALFSELLPESSAPLELRLVFHKENPLGCPENGTYSWEDDSEVVEPFAIVVRRGTNYTALQNAYIAGASAVVVVNYDDTEKIYMALPEGGFSVDIPMVIVASSKGEALIDGIVNPATPPGKVRAYLSEDDAAEQALFNQAH
eukprot:gene6529-10750_t